MTDQELDRVCGVCGDKALARNFGAISCESCKLFFRRVHFCRKTLKCKFDNKCRINKKNRKSCKKCRLDKCYAIGMRKEMVMTRVNNKRDKCKKSNNKQNNSDSTPDSTEESIQSPDSTTDIYEPNGLILFDIKSENLVESDAKPIDAEIGETKPLITRIKSEPIERPEVDSSVVSMAIVRPIATFDKQLNDVEIYRLNELNRASSNFRVQLDPRAKKFIEVNSITDFYKAVGFSKTFDKTLQNASKFCKRIEKFKEIGENDKLILFKSSCWNLNCLRNLASRGEDWIYVNPTYTSDCCIMFKANIMRESLGETNFDSFQRYWSADCPKWAEDPNLVNLFMTINLFDYALPKLVNKNLIKLNQQIYLYLLQRYLTQKYRSDVKSSESLCQIMACLKSLQTTHKHKMSIAKQFEQYFSPLVRETFDV